MTKTLAQLHTDWNPAVATLGRAATIQETDNAIAALRGIADEAHRHNPRRWRRVFITRANCLPELHAADPDDALILWAADLADLPWPEDISDSCAVELLRMACEVAGDTLGPAGSEDLLVTGMVRRAGFRHASLGTRRAIAALRLKSWPENE
jgi:hypothetical protein